MKRHPVFGRGAVAAALALTLASISSAAVLSLDDAIRLALQRNQRLKVSAFDPQVARANVLAAYGGFDPAITFRRNYSQEHDAVAISPLVTQFTRTDDYALSLGGLTPWGLSYSLNATATNQRGDFNRFSNNFITFGGVSVTQPLLRGFGFGANLANLRIAKADRGISEWEYRQTVIDTVTNVILAYNNVALARENVRIAQLSRDLAAQLVQQNERRNKFGQMSDADVLQARARLATRDEGVLLSQRAADDLQNSLRELVGESQFPVDGPAIELDSLPPATPLTVSAAEDLKKAFALRPDYQAARLGVARRRASSAQANNQLLPRVDFVGSYGYNGFSSDFATARQQVRDQDVRAYSAGLVVSIPITFAEGRGRARAARLGVRQSEADLVRLEQDIALDVSAAAGQIETTRARVLANRKALDLSQQSLDAEQKKFQAGTSSTFLVLQAQEQLTSVQSSYVRALADERRAVATYEHELGVTLEAHGIKLD